MYIKRDSFNHFVRCKWVSLIFDTISQKPRSPERVPRKLTEWTRTEREQNSKEQIQNGNGMDTERIQNGYRTDAERERERVWNGNRTRSLKRSLLGFFWLVLYVDRSIG